MQKIQKWKYVANFWVLNTKIPVPVAACSKAWICGRSLAGIACSKTVEGMDVFILWVLCVVR